MLHQRPEALDMRSRSDKKDDILKCIWSSFLITPMVWMTFLNIILKKKKDIFKIYIPKMSEKDEKIWPFTRNGQFSAKSAYKALTRK